MAKRDIEALLDSIEGDEKFAELAKKLDGDAHAGWTQVSDDLAGFWAPELCGIYCIPQSVRIFDGNIDKTKPSMLITVELHKSCIVVDKEGNPSIAGPGELVGIWFKPGMKRIRDLAGQVVYMKEDGEKDVGKGNPMKLYKIETKDKPVVKRVPVSDDTREKSKHAQTVFDPPAVATKEAGSPPDDDDIPF